MKKITIKKPDGTAEEIGLLDSFKIDEIDKSFVILSKGESAGDGLDKIYIPEVKEVSPGVYKMISITDDNTWTEVKNTLKDKVNGVEKMSNIDVQTLEGDGIEVAKPVAMSEAGRFDKFINNVEEYKVNEEVEEPTPSFDATIPKEPVKSSVLENTPVSNLEPTTMENKFDNNPFETSITETPESVMIKPEEQVNTMVSEQLESVEEEKKDEIPSSEITQPLETETPTPIAPQSELQEAINKENSIGELKNQVEETAVNIETPAPEVPQNELPEPINKENSAEGTHNQVEETPLTVGIQQNVLEPDQVFSEEKINNNEVLKDKFEEVNLEIPQSYVVDEVRQGKEMMENQEIRTEPVDNKLQLPGIPGNDEGMLAIQTFLQKYTDAQTDKQGLRNELTRKEREGKELREIVFEQSERIKNLEEANKTAEESSAIYRRLSDNREKEAQKLKSRIEELDLQLSAAKEEIRKKEIKRDLDIADRDADKERLENKISQLEKEKEMYMSEIEKLKESVKDAENRESEELLAEKQEKIEIKEELEQKDLEIEDLKNQIREAKKENSAEIEALESELKSRDKEIEDLKEELNKNKHQESEQNLEHQEESDDLRKQLDSKDREIAELTAVIEKKNIEFEKAMDEKDEKIVKLREQIKSKEKAREEEVSRRKLAESERERLVMKLYASPREVNVEPTLESTVEQVTETIPNIEEEVVEVSPVVEEVPSVDAIEQVELAEPNFQYEEPILEAEPALSPEPVFEIESIKTPELNVENDLPSLEETSETPVSEMEYVVPNVELNPEPIQNETRAIDLIDTIEQEEPIQSYKVEENTYETNPDTSVLDGISDEELASLMRQYNIGMTETTPNGGESLGFEDFSRVKTDKAA